MKAANWHDEWGTWKQVATGISIMIVIGAAISATAFAVVWLVS